MTNRKAAAGEHGILKLRVSRAIDTLVKLIRMSIDPPSWIDNGGTIGSIMEFDRLLVVTQNLENHRAIADLLGRLREAKAKRPPTPRQRAARADLAIRLVGTMKETAFEPSAVGLIAVGGLKDDVPREPKAVIAELEGLLPEVKSMGLRNAIRLTLRDLYKQTNNPEELLLHLRAMLLENDAAAAGAPPPPRGR